MVFAPLAAAQPSVEAVVNGASSEPLVSAGSVVSIFGDNLAASTLNATEVPLPASLNGVSVTFGEVQAPLYFVSANQINAQIPFEVTGEQTTVAVTTPKGQSPPFSVHLVPAAPGIFTLSRHGEGNPILVDPSFRLVDTVRPGERVILYATGLGPTDPPAATGDGGAVQEPFNRVIDLPEVFIGGQTARVEFAGIAPGFVAAYQLNVVVPEILATSTLTIASAEALDRIELLGVGNISARDVSAEKFEVRISGVGSVEASGDTGSLDVLVQGVGNASLFGLAARRARVQIIGVGNAEVNAAESLFARVDGVGNVYYAGNPQELDTQINGFGNIEPRCPRSSVTQPTCTGDTFSNAMGV